MWPRWNAFMNPTGLEPCLEFPCGRALLLLRPRSEWLCHWRVQHLGGLEALCREGDLAPVSHVVHRWTTSWWWRISPPSSPVRAEFPSNPVNPRRSWHVTWKRGDLQSDLVPLVRCKASMVGWHAVNSGRNAGTAHCRGRFRGRYVCTQRASRAGGDHGVLPRGQLEPLGAEHSRIFK